MTDRRTDTPPTAESRSSIVERDRNLKAAAVTAYEKDDACNGLETTAASTLVKQARAASVADMISPRRH